MSLPKIKLTFPSGDVKEFAQGITGEEIAKHISQRLADEALAIRVGDKIIELTRPLTFDAKIQILTFHDDEGKEVYWHSSSHVLAHAIDELFPGAKFGVGPAIEQGFYYDIDVDRMFTQDDLLTIERKMVEIVEQDRPFVRKEISKSEAAAFFKSKGDQYKCALIEGLNENEVISIYTEGSFTDLCRGPHISSTKKIKYIKLLSVSGSYWKGDSNNAQMQRIYGISFPKKKELDEYVFMLEEAKKRDHRKLGRDLELFTFHDIAPGAPFWLPRGMIIFRELETLIRQTLDAADYDEILTPILVKKDLWEQSGHWEHYRENMFIVEVEEELYSLKPMNCPESTYIYRYKIRSYRDLPLRLSELGRNHRNELSGVLNGMFRVRQFHMDDAHIFLRPDQILSEITNLLGLVRTFYSLFGFEPSFALSTRPKNSMGDIALWDEAEKSLQNALHANKIEFKVNEGDGAFYGPKIDISIRDALKRSWQLATIQLDFQLPERFKLEYIDEQNERQRPVMIHRAIMGSMERFIGILIEHYAGDFPTWLAPVQVAVLPISEQYISHAQLICDVVRKNNIRVELDARNEKIGYKIRDWEMHKVPYMIIIGEKEIASKSISVRKHKRGDIGLFGLSEFIEITKQEIETKQ